MRYIDADELKKNFQDELCKGIACAECSMQAEGFCRVERWIDIAPTVPIAESNSCEYWDSESKFCALHRPQAEVKSDIDENWYSDEYRRIGEDERDEVEE